MARKVWLTLFVFMITVGMLAACGGNEAAQMNSQTNNGSETNMQMAADTVESTFPRTITHVKGELTLQQKPVKIASLDIMATDYLLVLDETPIVSEGMSTKERSDIFAEYADGKDITDLGSHVNMEMIVEKGPDLMIMSSESRKVSSYEEFNRIADTVVIDFSKGVRSRLMQIAELVGKEEKAKQIIADFDEQIKKAKNIAADYQDETVLFLISNGKDFTVMDPRKFKVYYEDIGLKAPEGLPEEENGRIGIEALSAINPDHIFIAENRRSMNGEDRLSLIRVWQENPVWENLKAVKNNHVYPVDTLVGDTFFLGQVAGVNAVIENLSK